MDQSAQNVRTADLTVRTADWIGGPFLKNTSYENIQFQRQIQLKIKFNWKI